MTDPEIDPDFEPDPAFLDDPSLLVSLRQIRESIEYERGLVRRDDEQRAARAARRAQRIQWTRDRIPRKRRARKDA